DPKESVEGPLGSRELDAVRPTRAFEDDLTSALRDLDLARDEGLALFERCDGGALHESGDARGRILDEILDRGAKRRRGLEPADAPSRHGPILGEGLRIENALFATRVIMKGGCAGLTAVDEAPVDFIGDDPKVM